MDPRAKDSSRRNGKKQNGSSTESSLSRKMSHHVPAEDTHQSVSLADLNNIHSARLTRRPLRASTSRENDSDPTSANSSMPFPLLIPKIEKIDDRYQIPRDPRQGSSLPVEPITSNEEGDEEQRISVPIESPLHSEIDIDYGSVKKEPEDGDFSDDWKKAFIAHHTATLHTPTIPNNIHVLPFMEKGPVDEDTPMDDDQSSVDSGSTVGLPSPTRSAPSSQPASPRPSTSEKLPTLSPLVTRSEVHMGEESSHIDEPPSLYSAPTDLQEEYRRIEQENLSKKGKKLKEKTSYSAILPGEWDNEVLEPQPSCSQENPPESRSEDIPDSTENDSQDRTNTFNYDNDELLGCDDDFEADSIESSSLAAADDSRISHKRPLYLEESSANEPEAGPSKRSKFQVVKNPDMFDTTTASTPSPTNLRSDQVSSRTFNTDEPSTSQSNLEAEQDASQELENGQSSAQPETDANTDKSSNTPRIPVKVTKTNRFDMMLEDMIATSSTTQVPRKRPVTPSKNRPRRNSVSASGSNSGPPSPSNLSVPEFTDVLPGIQSLDSLEPHPSVTPNPDSLALVPVIRDPRLRTKQGTEKQFAATTTSTTRPPSLSPTLRNILVRVLKWQYSWIEQQANLDEPPPLLQTLKVDDLDLPDLSCVPVLSKYRNLEHYLSVFHPIMLHEMWSRICQQHQMEKKDKRRLDWEILVKSSIEEDYFFILQCFLVVEEKASAPAVNDLVLFSFPRPYGGMVHPFAHVESVVVTKLNKIANIDQRLLKNVKPKFSVEAQIRVVKGYASRQTNVTYPASKIASLASTMALFNAQSTLASSSLCSTIFNPQLPAFEMIKCPPETPFDRLLNPAQAYAAISIAQTMVFSAKEEPKVAILQGFPGTGKTHLLVYLIQHLVNYKQGNLRNKILYCAPTNAAVDEMVRRFQVFIAEHPENQFEVLRFGSWARLHSEVANVTFEEKVNVLRDRVKRENPLRKEISDLQKRLHCLEEYKQTVLREFDSNEAHNPLRHEDLTKKLDETEAEIATVSFKIDDAKIRQEEQMTEDLQEIKNQIIMNADVICTTLDDCYNTDMANVFVNRNSRSKEKIFRPFLCCVIDDASLCTEPQTLIPLSLGVNKLILVGDIELSPLTLSSSVAKFNRLDQSLFSRFHAYVKGTIGESQNALFTLDIQHRMVDEICRWPSKYYYGNGLRTVKYVRNRTPFYAYRVLDIRDSEEATDGSSLVNHPEAEVVAKLVEGILQKEALNNINIAIITFFEKQRILIRHLLRERFPNDYKRTDVRLVEDLQGTESEIVIISCVKTKTHSKDKYLPLLVEHLNVALTRATESLFICGNLKCLQKQGNEVLNDLICDAEKRQIIRTVSSFFHPSLLYDLLLLC